MAYPELSPERFALVFPSYSRERQKEINRADPNYSPKSWFSTALADKRGLNLQSSLERLKLKGFPDYDARAAAAVSRMKSAVRDAELETMAFKTYARAMKAQAKMAPPRTGRAMPAGGRDTTGATVPTVLPTQGVGLGVHNEGTPHFGVVAFSESQRGTRGRGDLAGGRQVREPRQGALDLAMFLERVEAQERLALDLAGKPGGRKAHKSALNMRRAYNMARDEHQSQGFMQRLEGFNEHAGRRTSRGKAAAEKIKSEKAHL